MVVFIIKAAAIADCSQGKLKKNLASGRSVAAIVAKMRVSEESKKEARP